MPGGSEIKNVLTLDVTKFTSAIDRATNDLGTLDSRLKSAAKVAAEFDKNLVGIGGDIAGISDKFKLLDQTVGSLVGKLVGVIGRFDDIGRGTSAAAKGVERLGDAVKKTSSLNAEQWVAKYAKELDKLAPAIKTAVASIIEFDRANVTSGDVADKMATKTVAAKLRVLEAEKANNAKILTERERLAAEIRAVQTRMENEATVKRLEASKYFGKNAGKGDALRAEAAELSGISDSVAQALPQLEILIKELRWKNEEIAKSVKLIQDETAAQEAKKRSDKEAAELARINKQAENEAARATKQAIEESSRAAKQAARDRMQAAKDAADFERQQAQQLAQMWKGIGQLWAASKIEHGMAASASSADKFQREKITVESLNLSREETDYITQKSWDDSKVLKFASALDVIKARMAGIGGLAQNNVEVLDNLLPKVLKAAYNIQYITGDKSEQGLENMVRNIFGVIESRGQTRDMAAAGNSIDLIQRIYSATGKKIDIADLEMLLRRDAPGADKLTDEGIAKLVAFMDAAKVAGGHGQGAAGAGISTVGTAVKMFQKMANGGLMTERAAQQFAESGLSGASELMDLATFDPHQARDFGRKLREGGLNVAELANADPVAALEQIAKAAIGYMGKPENLKKYFGSADVNDPRAIKDAMMKFAIGTGWSTTGVGLLAMAGNRDIMDRAHHQEKLIMGAQSTDEMHENVMKSYGANVDSFKSSVENLKVSLGNSLLPVLTEVLKTITKFADAAADFAKNNPMATQMGLATAAVIGLNMAIKGVVNTFGLFGNAANVFKTIATSALGMSSNTNAATGSLLGFGSQAAAASKVSLQNAMANERSAEAARVLALRQLESAQAVVASKTGFERLTAVQNLLVPAQQNIAKATAEHTAAVQGVNAATKVATLSQTAMSVGAKALSGALSLVGGPIGLISLALVAGISLWEKWGGAAETAASKAAKAADTALEKLKKLQDEDKYGGGNLGQERKTLETLEETLSYKVRANASDLAEFREKVDVQRRLVEELERREAAANQTPAVKATPATGIDIHNPFSKQTHEHVFEDLFVKTFQDLVAKAKEAQLKIDAIVTGEQTFSAQAEAMVFGRWAGGQLDKGHDPRNREFVRSGFRFDAKAGKYYDQGGNEVGAADAIDWDKKGANGKTLADMKAEEEAILRKNALLKSITFATERYAAMTEEANAASDRYSREGLAQETDAMKALKREFSREDARNPDGSVKQSDAEKGMTDEQIREYRRQMALLSRARIDASSYAFDTNQKTKDAEAGFLTRADGSVIEDADRIRAQHDEIIKKFKTAYAGLAKEIQDQLDAVATQYGTNSEEYERAMKDQEAAATAYANHLKTLQKQEEESLLTPLQKLVLEWKKVNTQIDQMEAQWATGFIDNLQKALNGGKVDWRTFLLSMASDIEKMMLKDSVGGLVKGIFGGLGDTLKSVMAGKDGGAGDWFGRIAGGLKDFWNKLTGATEATGNMTAKAAEQGVQAAKDIIQGTTKQTVEASATTALAQLATAAEAAANALAAIGGSGGGSGAAGGLLGGLGGLFGGGSGAGAYDAWSWGDGMGSAANMADFSSAAWFANGGIMTEFGAVALRKYANGGVANTPQMAIYGEGSMAEAYVPLPDGRSIPVTMKMAGAGQSSEMAGGQVVNISIVVNSDGSKSTSTSEGDDRGTWNKVAQRVKAVVREEMIAQQRPGGILHK